RAQRRSARAFRTPTHVAKRSRFAVGGIRSARKTIAGKFSAGLHPRRAHYRRAVFGREGITTDFIDFADRIVLSFQARLTEGYVSARPARAERPSRNGIATRPPLQIKMDRSALHELADKIF